MLTILEYIWITNRIVILRLLGLHLLEGPFVEAVIHESLPRIDDDCEMEEYEHLMRHNAYRRVRGALRQVRWA